MQPPCYLWSCSTGYIQSKVLIRCVAPCRDRVYWAARHVSRRQKCGAQIYSPPASLCVCLRLLFLYFAAAETVSSHFFRHSRALDYAYDFELVSGKTLHVKCFSGVHFALTSQNVVLRPCGVHNTPPARAARSETAASGQHLFFIKS